MLFGLKTVANAGSPSHDLFSARLKNARQFNAPADLSCTHSLGSTFEHFVEFGHFSLLVAAGHLLTFTATKPLLLPDEVLRGWEVIFVITRVQFIAACTLGTTLVAHHTRLGFVIQSSHLCRVFLLSCGLRGIALLLQNELLLLLAY